MDYHYSSKIIYTPSHLLLYPLILLLAFFHPGNVLASEAIDINFDKLDDRFKSVSSEIYQYYSRIKINGISKVDNITELGTVAKKYIDQDDSISAVSLLILNLNLIKNNTDDRSILFFITLLLENNEWKTANDLFAIIKNEGEKSLVSNASYIFAKYYFMRNKWQECLNYTADIYGDLADTEANLARIMTGISLQNSKQHRKAIEFYEKVPAASEHYLYARLNIAVAYIRQGWWTDARNAINEALKLKTANTSNDEMINRLYLVLGYSLLQKEYYRDSREAFRNISTNSQYENRALLGIGLASANQGDYIGALNALSILKNKNALDLSVDESYLLFPFVYKKLGQKMTASTSYNEAIQYYQARIRNLDGMIAKGNSISGIIHPINNDYEIVADNNVFEYENSYPVSFISNLNKLQSIKTSLNKLNSKSKKIIEKTSRLHGDYNYAYVSLLKDVAKKRREYLNSYLNQSRYGLANLYDNEFIGNN